VTFLNLDEKKQRPSMSTSSVGIPTMTEKNGRKDWRLNGEHHLEDGPAIEYKDGSKEWFLNGQLHRED
jgi:hypothetical protein